MAKSSNQKLKLLYLLQYLYQNSDENHPVPVAELLEMLEAREIPAERKSIYADIEALQEFGIDIMNVRTRPSGYYIASREFELPELKLLVDSIQSSKFISRKKTMELIRKITGLANHYEAANLRREVHVNNRVKSMNESVYYLVDRISEAINANSSISFRYLEYARSGEKKYRREGKSYEVSPFTLLWDDENYYLLARDDQLKEIRHYRVDKMENIRLTGKERLGLEEYREIDMSAYSKKVFGMFRGEQRTVKMRFANGLMGAVIDRFGEDLMAIPSGKEQFVVTQEVAVSPQFFAWLSGFGAEAEILFPPEVRERMKEHIAQIAKIYE